MTRLNRSVMHSRLVRSKTAIAAVFFYDYFLKRVQHEPSRCNALCYEVIMEFMPIQNFLVIIRFFRLLASYYDRNLFGGYECSWH